jgi:Protein of unknown function (DUF3108)
MIRAGARPMAMAALKRNLVPAAALAAIALAIASPAAEADTLRVRYSVALLGVPFGTANLTGTLTPDHYRLDASAKLTGIGAMVGRSSGAATATGAVSGGHVAPATYAITSSNAKETRTVRMAISGGAVSGLDVSPPFEEKPGRVPVTEAHKRNVVDPLAAVLMPVASGQPLLSRAACDRSIPVYDGNSRFDITLSFRETRKVKAHGYEGEAVVCTARYTPIAGHRPDRKATQFMAANQNIEVWLAPVESAHVLVPFKVSVATLIGTTTLTADDFEVQGGR